jgi:hypothetical protein
VTVSELLGAGGETALMMMRASTNILIPHPSFPILSGRKAA